MLLSGFMEHDCFFNVFLKMLNLNIFLATFCQESQELLQNSTDEMKISNDSDEPEPSERRTNQESEEHFVENDGDQATQEMQELVELEVSNVNHVTSDESATSPRSVLPDMLLPLDLTYTLTSESLELTSSDSQPQHVIPYPEPPQLGGDGNSRETEVSFNGFNVQLN